MEFLCPHCEENYVECDDSMIEADLYCEDCGKYFHVKKVESKAKTA